MKVPFKLILAPIKGALSTSNSSRNIICRLWEDLLDYKKYKINNIFLKNLFIEKLNYFLMLVIWFSAY